MYCYGFYKGVKRPNANTHPFSRICDGRLMEPKEALQMWLQINGNLDNPEYKDFTARRIERNELYYITPW